jgi:general stress protein 26
MDVKSFAEIEQEFLARVKRIVWCTVATVDTEGQAKDPDSAPNWEGTTAWICTGRNTLKAKHLAANPKRLLCYWDQEQENVYVEGTARGRRPGTEATHLGHVQGQPVLRLRPR